MNEHDAIIQGWKEYFGRLPPAVNADSDRKKSGADESKAPTKQTPQEQRRALGIVDNDNEEWDVNSD